MCRESRVTVQLLFCLVLICQAVVFELGRGGQPEECGSFYASPFVGSEGVVKLGFRHHYYLPEQKNGQLEQSPFACCQILSFGEGLPEKAVLP